MDHGGPQLRHQLNASFRTFELLSFRPSSFSPTHHFFSGSSCLNLDNFSLYRGIIEGHVPFFIEGLRIPSSIQINNAVSTAPPNLITVYQGSSDFQDAAQSLADADECRLHCYKGIYYNIPAGWEDALNCVLGIQNAEYHEVESIAIGERLLRELLIRAKWRWWNPGHYFSCSVEFHQWHMVLFVLRRILVFLA
ncbi:hypothetical protein BDR07DRAFT_1376929 [Suillus spraguei]|nr:hypothetical protein BDR07DRAFT_1376929 [Suillus spraguei]